MAKTALSSVLLASLPPELAAELVRSAHVHRYARGTTIFLQGEEIRSVFIVLDGWVKLYRTTQNGAEAVVGVQTSGGCFGEAMVLRHAHAPVAAEAVTDARLLCIDGAVIQRKMQDEPDLVLAMLSSSYAHMRGLIGQIEQLKAKSGAQRLATFLLDLCPCKADACTVTLPYEKVLIAGRLGLKPESLSRAFARLKSVGVRVNHCNAAIADVAALRRFAEEDRGEAWSRAL
jgi:CRP-like cAMP-binding protein